MGEIGALVASVSFEVHRSEIVSLCGLLGMGQNEVARALIGDGDQVAGSVRGRVLALPITGPGVRCRSSSPSQPQRAAYPRCASRTLPTLRCPSRSSAGFRTLAKTCAPPAR